MSSASRHIFLSYQESSDVHLVRKDEESVLNQEKAEEELQKTSFIHIETVGQQHMGKIYYFQLCIVYWNFCI